MKIVCDGCGKIISDKDNGRVEVMFPIDKYRGPDGKSLERKFFLCFECTNRLRIVIEKEIG
jgi:hypothetical protein